MRLASKFLLIQNTFFEFGVGLFGPIYAIFVEQIGGNILDAGIAWAIFLISIGVFEIIVAKYIDSFKEKRVLIVTNLLYALCIFLYVFVSQVYHIFILQLLTGIIVAVDGPAWTSWYAKLQKKNKRGHDFALMYMSNNIAKGVAILIGASLAYFFGFKLLFIFGSLSILVGLPFLIKAKK